MKTWVIASLIIAALVLILAYYFGGYLWTCRESGYTVRLRPDERDTIHKLVKIGAPAFKQPGKDFRKADVEKVIGQTIDPDLYFYFKRLLEKGTLSEDELTKEMQAGSTIPSL